MTIPKISILERELVSHIRESAKNNDSSTARAMAATVIVASDASRAAAADAVIDRLMGLRPARVLHVRSEAEGPARAWTSARCALDRASRGVCFEDIFIESPDSEALDPRIWGPFMIRELPAILFWNFGPRDLTECGCGPYCAERVDLVITDGSVDFERIGDEGEIHIADLVEAILEASSALPAYVDLAWKRLENLRLAVSRLFEGKDRQADAVKIESISMSMEDRWSAMLVEGWLRSRLAVLGTGSMVDIKRSAGAPAIAFQLGGDRRSSVSFASPSAALIGFPDGSGMELGFRGTDDGLILANLLDDPAADALYREAVATMLR